MACFAPLLVSGDCQHEGFPAQHVWLTLHAKKAMICEWKGRLSRNAKGDQGADPPSSQVSPSDSTETSRFDRQPDVAPADDPNGQSRGPSSK